MVDRVVANMVGFIVSSIVCIASMIPFLDAEPGVTPDFVMMVLFCITLISGSLIIVFYNRLDEYEEKARSERKKKKQQ